MFARVAIGAVAASVAFAQPALRGANMSRSLSDSTVSCEEGYWANINWCGGGGDWSCTPWAFTVDWTSDCEQHDGCWTQLECDGGDGSLIVGDDSGAGTYLPKWELADGSWCDSVACADQCGGANYFVFHTCDGAGLQSDCKGGQWYVEQLSQYNGERGWNSGDPQHGEVHPAGTTNPSFNFYHPGTANEYEWYWCGWWGKVETWHGFDSSANWITMANTNAGSEVSNSGSGHTPSWARDAFGGQDADATVALYPWICQNGADADKTGIQKGAAMYAGDHDDVWNCFCDNNGPNGHPGDDQPPPHYKLYSVKKEDDGWLHVVGVAGDAIVPGVSNEDFYLQAFDGAW